MDEAQASEPSPLLPLSPSRLRQRRRFLARRVRELASFLHFPHL